MITRAPRTGSTARGPLCWAGDVRAVGVETEGALAAGAVDCVGSALTVAVADMLRLEMTMAVAVRAA